MSESTRDKFQRLAKQWKWEVEILSSITKAMDHSLYQEIINMGPDVVPLIIEDLQLGPDHWFHALHVLTGANPVRPEDAGNMQAMADAWIEWGKKEGLV